MCELPARGIQLLARGPGERLSQGGSTVKRLVKGRCQSGSADVCTPRREVRPALPDLAAIAQAIETGHLSRTAAIALARQLRELDRAIKVGLLVGANGDRLKPLCADRRGRARKTRQERRRSYRD